MYVDKINPSLTLFSDGKSYSHDDLLGLVAAWQAKFESEGLKSGDVVGFYGFLNNTSTLASILAALESDLKLVNIPTNYYLNPNFFSAFFGSVKLLLCTQDPSGFGVTAFKTLDITEAPDAVTTSVAVLDDSHLTDAVFTFFTSGTASDKPSIINHTHDSVLFASEQSAKNFYSADDVVIFMEGSTLNHFGILTTTWLPALFTANEIVFYEHYLEHGHDKGATIVTLFDWQNVHSTAMTEKSMLAPSARILTGGVRLHQAAMDMFLANPNVESVYNVYGDTTVCTPLMWKTWTREEYEALPTKSQAELNPLDKMVDGLTIEYEDTNLTSSKIIKTVQHPRFYTSDPIPVSDNITNDTPARFIGRKNLFVCVHFDDGTSHNYQPFEIDYLLSRAFNGSQFVSFKYVIDPSKKQVAHVVAHTGDDLTVDQLNAAISSFEADKKVVKIDNPFDDVMKVADFTQYNNGLKLDYVRIKADYAATRSTQAS
ncbi:hypothetical protein RsoM2USA_219 [Ralstonia phage RsoM2USA]|nr:hypothetical protein RsoM2USA_219 [Ralstonia phage RsoM2USA]